MAARAGARMVLATLKQLEDEINGLCGAHQYGRRIRHEAAVRRFDTGVNGAGASILTYAPTPHKKAPRHPTGTDDGVFPVRAGTGKAAALSTLEEDWPRSPPAGRVGQRHIEEYAQASRPDVCGRTRRTGRARRAGASARRTGRARRGRLCGSGPPGGSRQSRPMSSRMSRITRTTPSRPLGP
jgi:hypothetical protein